MSDAVIEAAARLIREGKLVAFPTETVYGLGANALEAAAVEQIFVVKGRPQTSPLIVHVSSLEMARGLVVDWPERAAALAERFWPGPLTLVLPKSPCVPDRVTAGLPTVGIRMPQHPVALDLIRAAGVPIAAPSANRFTELSPTTAAHVRRAFGDRIAMILDGGTTDVGIESTVLSLADVQPLLLRPGMVTRAQIEEAVGPVLAASGVAGRPHASPGMHPRHYSPATPLLIVDGGALPEHGHGAYLWRETPGACQQSIQMPLGAREYARQLYDTLHKLDVLGLEWIAVERPPLTVDWAGISDRLERAADRSERPNDRTSEPRS
ncbi:MAG TPA: L-threonylcarbamoyladenylate synthase [Bryobacteraceae bacterium]|nr:L-threonylcarbamoyladenylate synthase [Bryobacteraceae bacterium]